MALYILKRLLLFIPTLLGITLITFILMQSLPGDPVTAMVGERASPETIARIRTELGLDRSLTYQYFMYLKRLGTGRTRPIATTPTARSPTICSRNFRTR